MKIYTKTGDKGQTSLFGGQKVSKTDIQIEAYGTVDELNSQLGLLISEVSEPSLEPLLKQTQSILFDVGSHLASDGTATAHLPQLNEDIVLCLENTMDDMTAHLPQLKSFILPGGNRRIALAHVCRTICRRAERRIIALAEHGTTDLSLIIKYVNRLSDYFFVLARKLALTDGVDEVRWNPK